MTLPPLEPSAAGGAGAPAARPGRKRPAERARPPGGAHARAFRCCSSSWCAASSATAWCASPRRDSAGISPPTSWSGCPTCRWCSGCRAARRSRCRPICWRTRVWLRCWASSSAATRSRACCRSWSAPAARADTQLDAGIGVRRLIESGILARHRGGRVGVPALAAARHRLSVGAATAARGHPPRRVRTISGGTISSPEMARLPQMAFHAARSGLKERGGAPVPGPRGPHERAARLPGRRAAVQARARQFLRQPNVDAQIAAGQGRGLMRFRLGRHDDALKDFTGRWSGRGRRTRARRGSGMLLDEGIVLDWTGRLAGVARGVRGGGRAGRRARRRRCDAARRARGC